MLHEGLGRSVKTLFQNRLIILTDGISHRAETGPVMTLLAGVELHLRPAPARERRAATNRIIVRKPGNRPLLNTSLAPWQFTGDADLGQRLGKAGMIADTGAADKNFHGATLILSSITHGPSLRMGRIR